MSKNTQTIDRNRDETNQEEHTKAADDEVASIPSVTSSVASILARLQREEKLPEITLVQASAADASRWIVDGAADIAVVDDWGTRSSSGDARLSSERCFDDSVVLAGPRGLRRFADRDAISILREQLGTVPLLPATEGHLSREFADACLARYGLSARMRWEFDGLDTIAELVENGHGLALLPRSVLARRGETTVWEIPAPSTRSVRCVRRRDVQSDEGGITRTAAALLVEMAGVSDLTV